MYLCRRMAEGGKIPRIEIGDAEQAGISRRHLGRVTGASEPRLAAIEPAEEARVVRIENENAHEWLDRAPEAVILVDPRLVGAAGDVTPPWLVVEVPLHGLLQSALETDAAAATEFGRELAGVDRIAVIVAGAVRHIGNELAAGTCRGCRTGRKARGEVSVGR